MTIMDVKEIAKLDLEKMRLETAYNVLRGQGWDAVDRLHVDHVLSVLRTRIDRIEEILRDGDDEI